jgi:hypothetical protein
MCAGAPSLLFAPCMTATPPCRTAVHRMAASCKVGTHALSVCPPRSRRAGGGSSGDPPNSSSSATHSTLPFTSAPNSPFSATEPCSSRYRPTWCGGTTKSLNHVSFGQAGSRATGSRSSAQVPPALALA